MSKVKEIRKIEPKVREIKKEKVESLEDEVEEDSEEITLNNSVFSNRMRFNKTATLDSTEISQPANLDVRESRIAKEDAQEVNFRPSYTGGGNPYENKSYTPVGSAESGTSTGERSTDRGFENRSGLQRTQEQTSQQNQSGGERAGERTYAGEREKEQSRDRRRRGF